MREYLADLDEILHKCYSQESKAYIKEAITCYKNGAFRACIVQAWVAVVFDFISKLRFLENQGDDTFQKEPIKSDFAKIKNVNGQPKSSLKNIYMKFEGEQLVSWARDTFQIITLLEAEKLEALKEARNLCAHPSMNTIDEVYVVSPEEARLHLVNAIECMLSKSPYGSTVLEKLIKYIQQPSFPTEKDDVKRALHESYFDKQNERLSKKLIQKILSELIVNRKPENEVKLNRSMSAVAQVMHEEYPGIFEKAFTQDIVKALPHLEDDRFKYLINFLYRIPFCWNLVDHGSRERIKRYLSAVSTTDGAVLLQASFIPDLKMITDARLDIISIKTIRDAMQFRYDDFFEYFLLKFERSESFEQSRQFHEYILQVFENKFSQNNLDSIFQAILKKPQLNECFKIRSWSKRLIENSPAKLPLFIQNILNSGTPEDEYKLSVLEELLPTTYFPEEEDKEIEDFEGSDDFDDYLDYERD